MQVLEAYLWSPDGAWIAFSSKRGGHLDLYRHAANGAGEDELLLKSDTDKFVKDCRTTGAFCFSTKPVRKTAAICDCFRWIAPIVLPFRSCDPS